MDTNERTFQEEMYLFLKNSTSLMETAISETNIDERVNINLSLEHITNFVNNHKDDIEKSFKDNYSDYTQPEVEKRKEAEALSIFLAEVRFFNESWNLINKRCKRRRRERRNKFLEIGAIIADSLISIFSKLPFWLKTTIESIKELMKIIKELN